MDPVRLELWRCRLAALGEEMGAVLGRCAFSPNIKERRDYSCALFDPAGGLAAQAAHIPVHLGAMPLSVAAALAERPPGPGDVVLLNDPYRGGSHLPDLTLVAGAWLGTTCLGLLANRAHHADVGGLRPGSLGGATEIFQEGLRLPPVRLVRGGEVDRDIEAILLANTRTPDERRGDLAAQLAAIGTGQARLVELAQRTSSAELAEAIAALQDYAERVLRARLQSVPDGVYRFADRLDHGPTDIICELTVAGDEVTVDLTGCGDQSAGSLNAVRAVTVSAVLYCFACLLPPRVPVNAGCLRPITIVTRPGSIVDALPPAAVAGGNVECSQRIVDVVLGALAQALPEVVPAASQGTMNNLLIGGHDAVGEPFTYYETIAGGMGGGPNLPGLSGVQVHMTNTLNTPVEALEYAYPLRVERYELSEGSGGAGRQRGGDGLRRDLRALVECEATLVTERRDSRPYGLAGGEPGAAGEHLLLDAGGEHRLPAEAAVRLRAGELISIRTPGGGGWGRA